MALPFSINTNLFKTNRLPTDEEYAQLTHHVDDHEIRLSALNKKISHLTKELDALKQERDTLVAEITPVKQALAPIRRVPEDVLREIFVACLDPNRNPVMSNTEAPVLLTHICSSMRRIALTTPALWAAIHIVIIVQADANRLAKAQETMQKRGQAVREWLQRSGSLPLSISIFDQGDSQGPGTGNVISPIMDVICKLSVRWKSVYFSCFPQTLINVCALGLEDLPLVQSVTFSLMRIGRLDAGHKIAGSKILSAPKLTHLGLDFIADVFRFKNNVAWSKLTHIYFPQTFFWEPNTSNTMNDVGDILRQTTCLVSCKVSIYDDLQEVLDAIHLPFLKVLTINDGHRNAGTLGLLAAIRAPVLDIVSYNMTSSVLDHPYALVELLKHSPSVTELAMGPGAEPSFIINCLRQCPELRTLHIHKLSEGIAPQVPNTTIMDALAPDDGSLCFCPMLENFRWSGVQDVSPESLQKFLETKRHSAASSLAKWKTVIIEFVARPDDLDIFIDIQCGQLGQDTNLYIGGSLHKESQYSVRDGIQQLDPIDTMWPSKKPHLYLYLSVR